MANEKKIFDSTDAAPRVLYAKRDAASPYAYPVLGDSSGHLILSSLVPYEYDKIELGYSGSNITLVTYYLNSVSVSTLSLAYTGSNLTIIERL